jgi:hypothetical protein
MTWLVLTFIGCWCLASALTGTAIVVNNRRMSGLVAGCDVLFSLASIGLLFLLLARMAS